MVALNGGIARGIIDGKSNDCILGIDQGIIVVGVLTDVPVGVNPEGIEIPYPLDQSQVIKRLGYKEGLEEGAFSLGRG